MIDLDLAHRKAAGVPANASPRLALKGLTGHLVRGTAVMTPMVVQVAGKVAQARAADMVEPGRGQHVERVAVERDKLVAAAGLFLAQISIVARLCGVDAEADFDDTTKDIVDMVLARGAELACRLGEW